MSKTAGSNEEIGSISTGSEQPAAIYHDLPAYFSPYKGVLRMKKIAAIFDLLLGGLCSAAQELEDWPLLQ